MHNVPDREDSFWQMLADIVRETSPIMGCCILLGLGAGIGGAVMILYPIVNDPAMATIGTRRRTMPVGLIGLLLVGGAFLGILLGLALGVVFELILEHLFGIKFDVPGKKKRKKRRRSP